MDIAENDFISIKLLLACSWMFHDPNPAASLVGAMPAEQY